MKERITWIDLAKGLLIILMVLGHVANFSKRAGVDDTFLLFWWKLAWWYVPFYMQTFFVLSGFTSNFDKDGKSFFKSMCRSLAVPFFVFALIQQVICMAILDYDLLITVGGGKFDFLTESFWFLPALFIAKTIYYVLNKYIRNFYVLGCLLVLIMIFGFFITLSYSDYEMPGHYMNYFHYRNGLCMAIFIWIGVGLKRIKKDVAQKFLIVSSGLYLVSMMLVKVMKHFDVDTLLIEPVGYSHWVEISSAIQIVPYMFYASLGSFTLILFSQLLQQNKILEYIGRNSIIIYLIHFVVMVIIVKVLSNFILPSTNLLGYLFFLIVGCSTMILSSLVVEMVNTRHLKWMVGK